ncbi:hypothetical protein [Nocardioides sp. Kera G14]|uniref:hypothetical protein n=1 Tax=Nocardioides sp. Kera G14 TaxID=2884264 RepID=UPI001D11FD37|nr:hypothetical protein [Nocardioides sp. Kera G14]UDY23813.1 hypothetical protein LH076_00510 [Nocardioides sp. Kera G14]
MYDYGEPAGTVHLCPECRDLMYDVLSAQRRVLDTPARIDPPDWVAAMNWLDAHCGGRQAVLTLTAAPLSGPLPGLPGGLEQAELERYLAVAELLDAAAERFFGGSGGEVHLALRRALVLLAERRSAVLTAERAVRTALGVVWTVAKANGLLHPTTALTEKTVREFLGSDAAASPVGQKIRTALRSAYSWADGDRPTWRWPSMERPADALTPLGQPGLLTAHTRSRLLEVRERALQAAGTEPWPLPAAEVAA